MARYAIYAYDEMFGGLNGMYSKIVVTCDSLIEASTFAREESLEIITTYPAIYEDMEEDLEQTYGNEYDEYLEETYNADVAYEIYEINEEVASEYSNEELEIMFDNEDDFVQTYCIDN